MLRSNCIRHQQVTKVNGYRNLQFHLRLTAASAQKEIVITASSPRLEANVSPAAFGARTYAKYGNQKILSENPQELFVYP
jgi:hypothetical protein